MNLGLLNLHSKAHILQYYPLLLRCTWRKWRQRGAHCTTESPGPVTCRAGYRNCIFRSHWRNSEPVGQVAGRESFAPPWLPSHISKMGAHVSCSCFKYYSCYARGGMLMLLGFSLSRVLSPYLFSHAWINDGNVF